MAGKEYQTVAGDVERLAGQAVTEPYKERGAELAISAEVQQFQREHPDQLKLLQRQLDSDNGITAISKWGLPKVHIDLEPDGHVAEIKIVKWSADWSQVTIDMDEQTAVKTHDIDRTPVRTSLLNLAPGQQGSRR